jgi:uncharacterized membrane protein
MITFPNLGTEFDIQSTDPFYSQDASNPASYLYVPPVGTYQNDAGQIVSKSTPNTTLPATAPTSLATEQSTLSKIGTALSSSLNPLAGVGNLLMGNGANSTFHLPSLEDVVVIIVGFVLIAAGVFAFKSTQTIIQTGGRIARGAAGLAA